MGIKSSFAKGYLAGKRGDEDISRLSASNDSQKRGLGPIEPQSPSRWSPIARRFSIRDKEEITQYEETKTEDSIVWSRVTSSVGGFFDVLRQRFGGNTSNTQYQGTSKRGEAPLQGEYRKIAYASTWAWGHEPDYSDKYDLKVYFWLPPGVNLNESIGKSIAGEAFRTIPYLVGKSLSDANNRWKGYTDDFILVTTSMERPYDFARVTGEYTHNHRGSVVHKWGPEVVGSSPYA